MTLPAVDSWDVVGVPGPKYKVGPRCSNPTCRKIAEHAHHIVRRSQLGGDYAWVAIEGVIVANLTGLCADCHDKVTGLVGGHKAAIRYMDGLFYWCSLESDGAEITYAPVDLLEPQPSTPETLAGRASEASESETSCPFCGHAKRRRRAPAGPDGKRRRRKTWTVKVPDDAEDGAEILDTLVDDLSIVLGTGDDSGARYYTLVPALVYAQQERKRFTESIKGRGA